MDEPIAPIGLADLQLDRAGATPLFEQLQAAIEGQITSGRLGRGIRLPAVRSLAADLGINRATVQRAYRTLEQRGLVASRVGSGTVVVAETDAGDGTAQPTKPIEPNGSLFSQGIRELAQATGDSEGAARSDAIDFAMMLPDVGLFPAERLSAAVNRALERGEEVLQYGPPQGLQPLREVLAKRLCGQGVEVTADDVVIVNGVQQALDLLAKVLLEPDDRVVVESPTYAAVLPLLKLYGADIESVPLDDDGISLSALAEVLHARRPKLIYTMPSFHNPTAVTMTLERRKALLELAARRQVLVLEDGCEQDLHFDEPLPPLAALATPAQVVHLGTFSKGLFPGLRLGYVVARGELRDMLLLAKRFTDYHTDLLAQAVLVELLQQGDYDRHLDNLKKTYGRRMRRTVAALSDRLPDEVRFHVPRGGYKVWLDLPRGVRASRVADEARRRGVAVLPGGPFFDGERGGESALRLSISRTEPQRIEEGIAILGEVLSEAVAARTAGGAGIGEAPPLI